MKQCSRCKDNKNSNEFGIWRGSPRKMCNECLSKQKIWRENETAKIKNSAHRKTYYANNKEKIIQCRDKRYLTPEGRIKKLLSNISNRCQKSNINFDLDIKYMLDMFHAQNGKCALTKIEFQLEKNDNFRSNPYVISIDRIIPNLGYTKNNIRLVCFIVNCALNEFGEPIFRHMCESYIKSVVY